MTTRNAFTLNLAYLKNQAKRRLKLLKNSDKHQWTQLSLHHPKQTLTPESVKLADIQLVIAREKGVSSWSALKTHIENQNTHLHAIQSSEPCDADKNTLHIRCGHDIQPILTSAGFKGTFLPWIDPYCVGPLFLDKTKMLAERARYVVDNYLSEMPSAVADVNQVIESEQANHTQLLSTEFERIAVWVEHDNYDQLMMVYLLAHMPDHQLERTEIIEVNQFPGDQRYMGLGQLPPQALRSVWQHRRSATTKMRDYALQTWHALCATEPNALIALLSGSIDRHFPDIKPVLQRHLQELPHSATGLSLTRSLALQILMDFGCLDNSGKKLTVKALFNEYQTREPLPFLGDLMFWALIKPLTQTKPALIQLTTKESFFDHELSLTEEGVRCIKGKLKWHSPNYWVGGIEITPSFGWQWDHKQLDTLAPYG
ncbi:DUF1835 domain-containing protein [Vibrio sp. Of7-15]|uniref:DUF1835 domain-containing protein n=1 Tax=Vibrio sp. Of7-15 TaxID=2724879 RepID=UPI001EF27BB9|nr:DUF1835 domain-containing protein [Vibrio sp. Of7-15]MCG7498038.1 DUF1835 domain-containing protein [Vibrio sp. Of7-15]